MQTSVKNAIAVVDKYSGKVASLFCWCHDDLTVVQVVSHVSAADPAAIREAIKQGAQAEAPMRVREFVLPRSSSPDFCSQALTSFQRKEALLSIAAELKNREEELAHALTVEVCPNS